MNGIEAMKALFDILKPIVTDVTGPNGRVYQRQRPANSDKEDIVINNLAMGREDGVQTGILNVNIHVPNQSISSNDIIDKSIPNTDRLNELTGLVEAFFPVETDTFTFEVQSDDFEEEDSSSYVNLRIEVGSTNINEH